MKILSINSDHTVSEHRIALNLDQELTPEFMAPLEYGSLKLIAKGTVLLVEKPDTFEQPFSREFVGVLQAKLDAAQGRLDDKAQRHREMQQLVAEQTGLPLD